MSKVTSKLQVTIPKRITDSYGIRPGDDLEWVEAGDAIRVELTGRPSRSAATVEERLSWFDQATRRQRRGEADRPRGDRGGGRGWTREELYDRGGAG